MRYAGDARTHARTHVLPRVSSVSMSEAGLARRRMAVEFKAPDGDQGMETTVMETTVMEAGEDAY